MKVLKVLALTGAMALAGLSAQASAQTTEQTQTQVSAPATTPLRESFWFFEYGAYGIPLINSSPYHTKAGCDAGVAFRLNHKFLVTNCRDSDNPAASQD